jgi:hypothetical protein
MPYVNLVSQDSAQIRCAQMKDLVDSWLAERAQDKHGDLSADENAGLGKLGMALREILGESIESTPADAVLVWAAACYAAGKVS